MFTTYKHVTGISKIQLKFLLIGVLLSLGLGSLVNLLLPSLGIYELNNLGPVFTLFLSGSIIYASTKHHLLETKVILSEVWSVILILTILVWLLMDPSIAGFIMFVMVSSISVLFVKSTLSESAKNEQITRQNAQLEKDKKKLLELDRMKDEFLQMATHELNTPIVSIQGRLHMAIVENFAKLNANQKEFLSPILRDTKRLASLSKNILDVARISQNRLHLFRTEVDFPDLVASIVEGFELRAKERGNKLIYHPPKEAIPLLYLDQVKITEVISNLLSNAIKFTDKGTVAVAVELKDSMVVISVSDSGIGISQEDQDKLFAKFYQANRFSKDRPQEQQGSGLGLFISKNIIELHGGKIWVSSTLGKGTTFYFSLPVKAKMGEKTTKK
ncbi:MAG: Alkaline phosphatase synthesis sensor protein PhoR [bacterium ADurb.Bin400]|nr:MAG: Alkaline phosphatase synthesis sensor protein PhoR [bacterium ADurb.Bin400]